MEFKYDIYTPSLEKYNSRLFSFNIFLISDKEIFLFMYNNGIISSVNILLHKDSILFLILTIISCQSVSPKELFSLVESILIFMFLLINLTIYNIYQKSFFNIL